VFIVGNPPYQWEGGSETTPGKEVLVFRSKNLYRVSSSRFSGPNLYFLLHTQSHSVDESDHHALMYVWPVETASMINRSMMYDVPWRQHLRTIVPSYTASP
jgi:hypothetical protein